jgi:hypothetical protein
VQGFDAATSFFSLPNVSFDPYSIPSLPCFSSNNNINNNSNDNINSNNNINQNYSTFSRLRITAQNAI